MGTGIGVTLGLLGGGGVNASPIFFSTPRIISLATELKRGKLKNTNIF
jgi:hypothetical protein